MPRVVRAMPKNSDVSAAWRYHDHTKHSLASVQLNRHYLDWANKPNPFKIYEGLPRIALTPAQLDAPGRGLDALEALTTVTDVAAGVVTLEGLTRLLCLSAGITHTKEFPDGERYHFRAAACTGALYHIDAYVICGDVGDLPAGVYQFAPHDLSLHQLRAGDHRARVVAATADEPAIARAPVIVALASTYWRNSWKYQDRAYRHCYWDSGTLLANLLSVAAAQALTARVVCGFVDDDLETLLGLDRQREGALALVALGDQRVVTLQDDAALLPIDHHTLPLSRDEVQYPSIVSMHDSSKLETPAEVSTWREPWSATIADRGRPPVGVTEGIDSVIRRRGSSRRFQHAPITRAQLDTLLRCADTPASGDFGGPHHDLYLIVNAVEGLSPGAYVLDRTTSRLELLKAGAFRADAGFLGLGQELPADAAVNIYSLTDLTRVLARFGNRGYRVAQLEAAIAGGRAYLAAYAMRLGATGLTFFDDDVTRFFSPHAEGKSVMFLTAVGHAVRRSRPSA